MAVLTLSELTGLVLEDESPRNKVRLEALNSRVQRTPVRILGWEWVPSSWFISCRADTEPRLSYARSTACT